MSRPIKSAVRSLSLKPVIYILALGGILINFIFTAAYQQPWMKIVYSNFALSFLLVSAILAILFWISFAVAAPIKDDDAAWPRCLLFLSPVALLLFWPAQETRLSPLFPLGIVALTQAVIFRLLMVPSPEQKKGRQTIFLSLLVATYFLIFSFLGVGKFNALQLFNPKDWAVYDQIFWNTLHGALFTSSFYGSYLAGHNTWFFFLLMPFYALFPHPLTLLILKTLILSLSVIPFYMITKNIFKDDPPIECILCFLFYPFLVAQNLNAPHEMGYAPFFILWTYYFYRTNRFLPFLCLLFLSLSIKEHLSAAAVGFGFYAWLHKKDFRWVITPVALGLFWGIFSLGLMSHFQKVYQPQSDPSWFATNFKLQYLSCQGSTFSCLIDGFFSFFSDLRGVLPAAMLLLLPLGILPPLLSSIALLALPEVLLDLLAKRSVLFSPIWHYNVASSCFLLIGSMEGIKKIAGWGGKHFKLTPDQARRVIAVLMLATVLIHSYTWLDFTRFKKDSAYVTTVREAIATVPATAFFTVPRNIAPLISRRERMSLLNEGNPGDFVLIDHSEYSEPLREPLKAHYKQIYRKNDIAVYQKIP